MIRYFLDGKSACILPVAGPSHRGAPVVKVEAKRGLRPEKWFARVLASLSCYSLQSTTWCLQVTTTAEGSGWIPARDTSVPRVVPFA